MKLFFNRFLLSAGFFFLVQNVPVHAQQAPQQQPPSQQPSEPAPPQQPGTPAPAQPPAIPSLSQQDQQPAQVMTAQQPVPPQKPSERKNTGDYQISLELSYWLTQAEPELTGGQTFFNPNPDPTYVSDFQFPGKSKRTPGIMLSFPAGKENTLRISYFTTRGRGDTVAGRNQYIFNTNFNPGDVLITRYNLQNFKVSWDYLTFPFPPESKFRLKTLWEVQYVAFKSSIDAPMKPVTADPDTGAFPSVTGRKTLSLFYPSFGLAGEYSVSKHIRLQGSASGFALPHRAVLWDAEGAAAFRFSHVEALVGMKSFHVKTSPKREEYVNVTMSGPYVGLRWYW